MGLSNLLHAWVESGVLSNFLRVCEHPNAFVQPHYQGFDHALRVLARGDGGKEHVFRVS